MTRSLRLPNRSLVLQRRSAVAFRRPSSIGRGGVLRHAVARDARGAAPPWDALWWDARIHLAIFVHRVDGVTPGLYCWCATRRRSIALRAACGREFLWERPSEPLPFYLLARGDCRAVAQRLSCDQDIAADGFFSLGMIADFDASLDDVRAVVLSPPVLGVRRRRSGAVSRSGGAPARAAPASAASTTIRCTTLLGLDRPRVPEPLSLHGRHPGRGRPADDGTGLRVGSADADPRVQTPRLRPRPDLIPNARQIRAGIPRSGRR